MNTWENRPQEASGSELIAWAICQYVDLLDLMGSISGSPLANVGRDPNAEPISSLQYLADRIGGGLDWIGNNLERIADQNEKGTTP